MIGIFEKNPLKIFLVVINKNEILKNWTYLILSGIFLSSQINHPVKVMMEETQ